jgi:hypothetical protein
MRASIFDDLDLSGFAPEATPAPPAEEVRAVSEAARFPSREGARTRRTYRTGRNMQFNVKASQAVIDQFYEISNKKGWVLGETLEHALAALKEKLNDC